MTRQVVALMVGVLSMTALWPASAAAAACESLAALKLPNAAVTVAQEVAAGTFTAPARGRAEPARNPYADVPAFCRVAATLTPSTDSDIKIEVWMPLSGWNGKYQAVGNGGWAGMLSYTSMATAVTAGYATASTDTGHTGGTADFALGHPEKIVDFGYRAIHEMAAQSKVVIDAFYGAPPTLSFFNGCSQGGRQAITAAQRYPADFDGIVAGAAAWDTMRMHALRTAVNQQVNKTSAHAIPREKLPMIHDAVIAACDGLDGVADGVIENPPRCRFDYAALTCTGADGPTCLTGEQVESAKTLTSPLKDPKTGRVIDERHLWPGSELGWATLGGPEPLALSVSGLKNIAFKDPNWDWRTFDVSTGMALAARSDDGVMASSEANLEPFFDRGGKLLMYHGWSDQQVTPQTSTMYYDAVVNAVGAERAANGIALFMMPGVNHCQGGPGTDTFDKMHVIEQWVATGQAPARIVASHATDGKIDRTRPLCPYPQVARYIGSGSTDDEANFVCSNP